MTEPHPTCYRPILVTGASGFVGRWLCRDLAERSPSQEVVATSCSGSAGTVKLDVTDPRAVDHVIAHIRPGAVIHLAAQSSVLGAESNASDAYSVNLFGSMHIADATLRYAPDCRFIYVSSAEVYGGSLAEKRPLDEASLLDPVSVYGVTKCAADLLMGQFAQRGLQVVRFRPFNHFGPGQSDRFVIPSFVRQIVAAEHGERPPIIEVGNVDAYRDFLDVRDVVRAYVLAVTRRDPLTPGTILNLASGRARRIGDILGRLIELSPAAITVRSVPERMRPSDIPFSLGDARRAQDRLGWRPMFTFDQTLLELLEVERKARRSLAPAVGVD